MISKKSRLREKATYRHFVPYRHVPIMTPVKRHPSLIPAVIKLDVIRRHMCLKRQPRRRRLLLTVRVINRPIRSIHRELAPDDQPTIHRYRADVPGGETVRIAVVAALGRVHGSVEVAVEIQFLAGVVLVDVLAGAVEIVEGAFDGVDAACEGVFG